MEAPWSEAKALAEKAADTHLALEDQDVEELGCWTLELLTANAAMLAALNLIAEFGDKTLIAPSLGADGDHGHQLGANKAFNQAAEIARDAIEKATASRLDNL
jgi:hypothetical protein